MPHNSGRPNGSHADSAGSASESPLHSPENGEMAGLRAGRSPGTLLTHACWMLCQYSRRRPVSSEKQETAPATGGAGGDIMAVGTVTVVVDGYGTRPEPHRPAAMPLRPQKY
jgi:hypothetical protein